MTKMMKRLGAALIGAFAVSTLLFAAPMSARAESLGDYQLKELAKSRVAARVAHNNSLCLNLTYVGSSTEAVVTIEDSYITAYAPANVADSSNFGVSASSYVFSSTYDTVGELCDAIDALANYECTLLGCNRSQTTDLLRDQAQVSGTNDLKAAGGFDVKMDTGSLNTSLTDVYTIRIGVNPGTGKRVVLKTCTGNINVIDSLRVYGKLRKYEGSSDGVTRDDTTLVWQATTADDTDLQIPIDITENGWLEFAKDAHVVMSGGHATGVQAAANFLECQWDEK